MSAPARDPGALLRRTAALVGDLTADLGAGLMRLAFPPACAVCRALRGAAPSACDGLVCAACWARVVTLPEPQCRRCGHPLPLAGDGTTAPACNWCPRLPPYIRAVRSAAWMASGTGGAIVHALKYGGWAAVAGPMAARMARLAFPRDVVAERTALVPVPLSGTRLRERGYNQAAVLARALAPHWGIPVWDDLVTRTRHTRSQVRLTPSQRAANVSQAFAVAPGAAPRLSGAHLLLVDDVVTTAATLTSVAEALVAGGARLVSIVTYGRAPDPGAGAAPSSQH